MKKKSNILHLRNCRGITTLTGPETYLIDLIKSFDKSKFNLLLCVSIDPENPSMMFMDELKRNNINFSPINVPHVFLMKELFYLSKLIRKKDITILHTHDLRSDFIGLLLGKIWRVPHICFAHGWVNWVRKYTKAWLYAKLEALIVSYADWVIVASQHMLNDSLSRNIQKHKIRYIPLGIDVNKYDVEDNYSIRNQYNIEQSSFLIGNISRIHPWKGQKFLIEAARIVCNEFQDTKFLIVGDIAFPAHQVYKNELYNLVDSLQLKNNIIFMGSRSDIPRILKACDIFVLSSTREPFGLVLLEAQASMTPVIATRVGGIPEAIKENETGIIVEPGDAQELAHAIIYLIKNKKIREKFGRYGRKYVGEYYSSNIMAKETKNIYLSIIKEQ